MSFSMAIKEKREKENKIKPANPTRKCLTAARLRSRPPPTRSSPRMSWPKLAASSCSTDVRFHAFAQPYTERAYSNLFIRELRGC